MSNSISEHLSHLREGYFCLLSKNKMTNEMDFLIFDEEQNIIRENKKAENLLYWIDALLILKYSNAKPWLTNYKIFKG